MRVPVWLMAGLLAAGFAFTSAADEVSRNAFAYGAQLNLRGQTAAYELEIPLVVYQRTVYADLRDVRVFNADGQPVPYALRRRVDQTLEQGEKSALPLFPLLGDVNRSLAALRLRIEANGTFFDLHAAPHAGPSSSRDVVEGYLIDGRLLKSPIAAFELQWDASSSDYSGSIKLESSDDLGSWRHVASAPIVNLHFGEQQLVRARLEFPATAAKFWRLTWEQSAPAFTLSGVVAQVAANSVELERTRISADGVTAASDNTLYEFDLRAHAPVDRIDIELPQENALVRAELSSRATSNMLWRSVAVGEFYRLKNGEQPVTSAPLAISTNSDRFWRVKLVANTSLRTPPKLIAEWIPHRLVFLASGRAPYELAFGSQAATSQAMAIQTLIPGWEESTQSSPRLAIGAAELLAVHDVGGAKQLEPVHALPWKSWLLWAALGLGILALAWMAYQLLKEMRGART